MIGGHFGDVAVDRGHLLGGNAAVLGGLVVSHDLLGGFVGVDVLVDVLVVERLGDIRDRVVVRLGLEDLLAGHLGE